MASRRLVVEIVGDASQLERTFAKSSTASRTWGQNVTRSARAAVGLSTASKSAERDVGHATRGFLAGSGVVSHLGRSLAFASGGFLAFATLSEGFRKAIDDAERLEKATDSLAVVIRRSNGDVGRAIPLLDDWAKAQTRLGVSEADALVGLRSTAVLTGSVRKGMLAYTMGLELARAENINMNSAMRISAKALLGQTTSLTRYGIILPKNASAQRVFNAFQRRFGEQAEANTSAIDRLRASSANLAAAVGKILLPIVEKYAGRLADWISKTRNQHRVTMVVKGVLSALGTVLRVVFRAGEILYRGLEKLKNLFHSWTPVIAGVSAALVALGLLNPWIALAAGAVFVITHWRQVKTFFHNLGREIVNSFRYVWYRLEQGALKAALAVVEPFSHLPSFLGGWARTAKDRMQGQLNKLHPPNMNWGGYAAKAGHDTGKSWREAFDLEVGDVFRRAERRRHHHGDPYGTDTPTTKSAAASGAAAADRAAQGFTLPYRLRIAEAKARATATVADDLKVARAIRRYILSRLRHLHGEKLIEAYDLLAQENQEIAADVRQAAEHAKKAHEHTRKAVDTWKQLNTRLLTAGLGLSAAQRKALRERLSQIGPGGTVSGGGTGAAGYVIDPNTGRPGDVYMDGKKVGKVVHRHQQRHRKRNPSQRRGPHAGVSG